jgi:hypothetical protein
MRVFTQKESAEILQHGTKSLKKANPVWLFQQREEFQVETNEGVLNGKAGDYVAHDPLSGHVWPVSQEYVAMHYEPVP